MRSTENHGQLHNTQPITLNYQDTTHYKCGAQILKTSVHYSHRDEMTLLQFHCMREHMIKQKIKLH